MKDEKFLYNKIFCQQCGLPMVIHSYEIKKESPQSEMIIIKLKCKNFTHTLISEINLEEYNESLKKNYNKLCKCKFCNSILQKDIKYCTHCNSIICENCYNKDKKSHNKIIFFKDMENKCLLHINEDKKNIYYCISCKREMCEKCISSDKEHFQNNKIDEIYKLKDFAQSDVTKIKNENESLLKQLKSLQNKINLNEILLKEFENNNNLNLFNLNLFNKNTKKKELLNNGSLGNDKTPINIIYHDSNFKKNGYYDKDKLKDCKVFGSCTKGNVIMTDDISNFNLLLKYISKNNSKSKFFLIVNGAAAEKVINLIRDNNYKSLFISSCIYTTKPEYFNDFMKKNSDLIKGIFTSSKKIIEFINNSYSSNLIMDNEKYYVNPIISIDEGSKIMPDEYFNLFKEISDSYNDESEDSFKRKMISVKSFVENEKFSDEIKNDLIEGFQAFSVLPQKNYEKIISCYLKNKNFSKILNLLLEKKDILIYKKINYFAGNLMHSIVQYGKKMNKEIVQDNSIFYKGLELNIIEFLEILKNIDKIITFPSFLFVTKKKEYAELSSKRFSHLEKNNSILYSLIMTFKYSHKKDYETTIYDLKDLFEFPDEEENVILPFTNMKINKIITDSEKHICDIELEIIEKKKILWKLKIKK